MKKERKTIITKMLCYLLTVAILCDVIGALTIQAKAEMPAASAIQETENAIDDASGWDGTVREKTWELDRCRITYTLADYWADGYTATIIIENISDESIENWHIAFPITHIITNLWNAQQIESAETTIFKNLGWNQDIEAGQSVTFGFTAEGAFDSFPQMCELPAQRRSVAEDNCEITYNITDAWDGGHTGELCIL